MDPAVPGLWMPVAYLKTRICAAALVAALATPAAASRAATPPAYLKCEAYVGEGQILEGLCRIRTLARNRVMVEEFSDETKSRSGYVFLFVPHRELDSVFWNPNRDRRDPRSKLGTGQFFDNCWRSVAHSEIPFSICLIVPKLYEKAPTLPF